MSKHPKPAPDIAISTGELAQLLKCESVDDAFREYLKLLAGRNGQAVNLNGLVTADERTD